MEQGQRRWIIRDVKGQIDGPFTTEKILYKIGRGEFSGDEVIAHYPNGNWIPISQDPQFYDKLLEVIGNQAGVDTEQTRVLEFTKPQSQTSDGSGRDESTQYSQASRGADTSDELPLAAPPDEERRRPSRRRKKSRPKDIELIDLRPEVIKAMLKRAGWPLVVGIGGLIVVMMTWVATAPVEDRIHLIAPQKNVAQVPATSLTGRTRQGVGAFLRDTLEGYIRSQDEFVYVVERNAKNPEVMALLCMTYLELWPFAHQDSADTKAVSTLVQLSSLVDPAGLHSATCRAVDLITRSRFAEAKSLVEAILDARANQTQPPIIFYFLKGYLLEATNDHTSAIGYLRSAEQLWPQWILPNVVEAQAVGKLERHGDAATIYRRILQANPTHPVARIELGLLEYKQFGHYSEGEQYLNQGLSGEAAPRGVLSRGYFGLAEIALKNGNNRSALHQAQRAFSLNSSNEEAKNLIVQLGGVQKLRQTKVKGQQLLFEGDQFFREGDCQAAQAHYKAAFEEDPKNAVAAMKAAQCLWKLSFSTDSMEWLNKAIRADPKLIEAYVTLADYQAQRYNFQAAAKVLEGAYAANPRSYEVFRGLAQVELRRGNTAGAIAFGKRALGIYANDVETQIILAQASLKQKDYRMGYNYAAKAIEIDVNHRQAQIVYAEALSGLQGIDIGVDYFLKLVNNYPLVSEYRLALGKLLLADERYQQAEEIFRQITHLDEKSKEAYIELAKVLKAQGSMDKALDLLLKAAVLDPSDAEPLYLAGGIYLDLHKASEAAVQFQRVLTINKLYPLVHYQLGRAALLADDSREAANQAEEEKRLNPNLADAYLLAAQALERMHQYSMAAAEYQKAIKLRPQKASIYVSLSRCYRQAGNLDAAITILNTAATKEPGLADIYKEQGAYYEVKGEIAHAIEAYKQYFALDPDADDRSQIEARISTLLHGQRP